MTRVSGGLPTISYDGPLITARQAFDGGISRYFTGKVCGNGHIAQRMVSNGNCVECLRLKRTLSRKDAYERVKVWRITHKDARALEAKKYRKKHPDKVAATVTRYKEKNIESIRFANKMRARQIRAQNPEMAKQRSERFRQKQEESRALIAGRPRPDACEICCELGGRIVFDHCHNSGEFRGWICDRCNKTLGHVHDDPEILRKLTDYLEKPDGIPYYQASQRFTDKGLRGPGPQLSR